MKVLLISPNVESLPDPVFPLGLAQIAAVLRENGIPYEVLDLCFVEDYETAIASTVEGFQPDLVGLSLRNIDNVSYPNYATYLPFFREVVRTIKARSPALVVVAGSGFSLMPGLVLEYLGADLGIVGEGEVTFADLIKKLDGTTTHERQRPKGLYALDAPRIRDLDSFPFPDRSKFDNVSYLRLGGMGNIQTKRGCPFECAYCVYPIIEGRHVRVRSPARVCDEIEGLLEQGVNTLFFVDSTFNAPFDHAEAVCKEMIRRKLDLQWSCYATPKFVTPELIEAMLKAGGTSVEFGSDAAHGTMLQSLCKNFTVEDLRDASEICRKAGMPFCHSLILGGPGETMETVGETVDAIGEMSPTAVICMVGTRVFPKTRLASVALEEGLESPDDRFPDPLFYLSPAVEREILPFIEAFAKENPTWIFPGLNINMNVELQKKLRRFGVKGPLWTYMKMGERFRRKRAR